MRNGESSGEGPAPRLLAAGSLAAAFAPIAHIAGFPVETRFGPSGLLREAIEGGAPWDVFVSADEGHPARLRTAGLAGEPRRVCGNAMALLVPVALAREAPLALFRRADLRLAISTPGSDPSGDYALAVFARAESVEPGLGDALAARALRLAGAPGLPQAPQGRNHYGWLLATGAADFVLTYRTNAVAALGEAPGLVVLDLPEALAIASICAAVPSRDASSRASALFEALFAPQLQERLAALGFATARQIGSTP